jgi:ABC-2 type transport system permease protein
MKKFFALLWARNKEFYRDKGTLIWNLAFPLLVILGFSYAFSGTSQNQYKVAVFDPAGPSAHPEEFYHLQYVSYVPVTDLEPAVEKVKRHQIDLLVAPNRYWINSTSPKGYFLERLIPAGYVKQAVEGRETRYVDWLIPGILAMNMMFSALFGVGYTIVRYRKAGVLKRFKATPVNAFQFLAAQVASRLLIIQTIGIVVYIGCSALVHFQMRGSYLNLFLFFTLGSICMISLSTVIAARIRSEELAEGILNILTWPMIFFSGVWFSLEGTNPVLQKVAQIFPMTHIVDGARAIMIDGAGLSALGPHALVLAAMTAVFLGVGSALFEWS